MTWSVISQAFALVFDPFVLWIILASSLFGLFVGAVPGLTATMATALLVPVTFFIPPVPAVAAIVSCTAMAIFAGDIPGALLRIPGTPASAAYTDEAYAMTRKGQAELALGAGLVFSAIGGLFGTAVLIAFAPVLAEVALKFSSFEYFWLVVLGLSGAVFIGASSKLKAVTSLMLGLFVASVGLDNPGAYPRFTFGNAELMGGVSLIPVMVGMFAVSEILRYVTSIHPPAKFAAEKIGNVFRGMWELTRKYKVQLFRGSAIGTAIGIQPGAGADIAAWITYAASKRFSKEPEKFGTGHVEGIVESGAANNSALAGAWVPALVFGIPGDSITAIAHPGQPDHGAARLGGDQGGQDGAARAAEPADAGDPAVLRGGRVRDQQHGVRRAADPAVRAVRVRDGGERLPHGARDPRRGARRHARGELRHLDDQGRRQRGRVLHAADRGLPGCGDAGDPGVAAAGAAVAPASRGALSRCATRSQPQRTPGRSRLQLARRLGGGLADLGGLRLLRRHCLRRRGARLHRGLHLGHRLGLRIGLGIHRLVGRAGQRTGTEDSERGEQ